MDPKACLDEAYKYAKYGDTTEALWLLLEYAKWRFKGGFQPPKGDDRYETIMQCMVIKHLESEDE